MSYVQQLLPTDYPACLTFSLEFLACCHVEVDWPRSIHSMVDKAHFYLDNSVNTHSCYFWGFGNSHLTSHIEFSKGYGMVQIYSKI